MDSGSFDWAKVGAVATGSMVMGVVFGAREGGAYLFEIGPNLMLFGLVTVPLVIGAVTVSNYIKMRF